MSRHILASLNFIYFIFFLIKPSSLPPLRILMTHPTLMSTLHSHFVTVKTLSFFLSLCARVPSSSQMLRKCEVRYGLFCSTTFILLLLYKDYVNNRSIAVFFPYNLTSGCCCLCSRRCMMDRAVVLMTT